MTRATQDERGPFLGDSKEFAPVVKQHFPEASKQPRQPWEREYVFNVGVPSL